MTVRFEKSDREYVYTTETTEKGLWAHHEETPLRLNTMIDHHPLWAHHEETPLRLNTMIDHHPNTSSNVFDVETK